MIFSQWTGAHELLQARFEPRKWNHVFFHGGVPGKNRKDLIRRFKEDPECRAFLSTDAGGVGLNLQNASVVVNMDQPWNPAVLEQRIGRVHRLGQHRPVQVINFVAQGTIEHSMLDLLAFKKSLFGGVLDGGQDEVFLGGTRLKRFMESVDQVTSANPGPMARQAEAAEEAAEAKGMETVFGRRGIGGRGRIGWSAPWRIFRRGSARLDGSPFGGPFVSGEDRPDAIHRKERRDRGANAFGCAVR